MRTRLAEITEKNKVRLEEEREKLLEDIEALQERLYTEVDVDEEEGDPELHERDKAVTLLRAMQRRLDSIDAALDAIRRGTYGICERCGKPIDPARLEAFPEARLCLKCQEEVERSSSRIRYRA
jgi:DnaK suppressor protein